MAFVILVTCSLPSAVAIETQATDDLNKAVAAMRKINLTSLSEKQKQAKSQELDKAWKTVVGAGPKGIAALKEEIRKIDVSKEKDDLKLGIRPIFREDWGKVLFSPNFKLAILRMRTQMLFYKMALLDSCFKAFEIGGVQLCLS